MTLGQDTTEKQMRMKSCDLSTKLNEKQLEMLEGGTGALDKDLGMITPGSMATEEVNEVKQEVPSLEKLQVVLKETQKTKLDLDSRFLVAKIRKIKFH